MKQLPAKEALSGDEVGLGHDYVLGALRRQRVIVHGADVSVRRTLV
jgi:hypothetical protein